MSLKIDRLQLEIIIDNDQSRKQLRELEDEMNDLKQAMRKVPEGSKEWEQMNTRMKSLKVQHDKVIEGIGIHGLSLKELAQRQKELNLMMRNMDPRLPEYKKLEQQYKDITARQAELRGGMRQTKQSFESIGATIKNKFIPMIVAAFSVQAVVGFIKNMVEVRKEFEKYEAVLTNTLGSKSAAQQSLQMIQDFASKTPFQVTELTGAFVKLANMGFKPTAEEMRKLGDLASSTGKGFDQLAEAIIDAQTGEFERLKEFGVRAKKEGDKVTFTFKGVQQQVDFTSESIKNYITGLGDLSGVSGSMAAISATLGGKISNLGDAWDALLNTIGKATGGIIGDFIKGLSDLVGWTEKLIKVPASETLERERMEVNLLFNSITSLNEGNEARGRLLGELQQKYPELLKNIDTEKVTNQELLDIQKQVNKTYLDRITLAVYEEELTKLAEKGKEAKQLELNAIKAINSNYDAYVKNKKEGLSIEEKAQALLSEDLTNLDEFTSAGWDIWEAQKTVRSNAQGMLDRITESQETQNQLGKEYNQILVQQIDLMAKNPSLTTTTNTTTTNKTVNTRQNFSIGGLQSLQFTGVTLPPAEEVIEKLTLLKETVLENIEGEEGSIVAKALGLDEEGLDGLLTNISMFNSSFNEAFSGINQIISNTENRELQKYTESNDKKKKLLKQRLDSGLISQEQYNKQVTALDEEYDKKKRKMEHDQAVRSKALALTDAVIKGALSVLNALNTQPFLPMGPIMAALAGVLSAIQIGVIASQPIPSYAMGKYDVKAADGNTYNAQYMPRSNTGIYSRPTLMGGLGLVGEKAPEMVIDGPTLSNIQMNAPEIIQAIHAMRVPQYAAGSYPEVGQISSKSFKTVQPDDSMTALLREISAKLDNPTRARIVWSDWDDANTKITDIKNSVSK